MSDVDNTIVGMNFGEAVEALKAGKKVARAGWNGKGMWLTLGKGGVVKSEDLWNDNTKAFAETLENKEVEVLPYILMKTADDKLLLGWLASQSDMLSEDWMIINTTHLCDSCSQEFATCESDIKEFGNGVGNDNVIACDGYKRKN